MASHQQIEAINVAAPDGGLAQEFEEKNVDKLIADLFKTMDILTLEDFVPPPSPPTSGRPRQRTSATRWSRSRARLSMRRAFSPQSSWRGPNQPPPAEAGDGVPQRRLRGSPRCGPEGPDGQVMDIPLRDRAHHALPSGGPAGQQAVQGASEQHPEPHPGQQDEVAVRTPTTTLTR